MSNLTNAQAALQAAATQYSGAKGYATCSDITGLAEGFKEWLDKQDAQPRPGWEMPNPRPEPSAARPRICDGRNA